MVQHTMCPLLHAQFCSSWGKGGYRSPQRTKFGQNRVFHRFFARQWRQYIPTKVIFTSQIWPWQDRTGRRVQEPKLLLLLYFTEGSNSVYHTYKVLERAFSLSMTDKLQRCLLDSQISRCWNNDRSKSTPMTSRNVVISLCAVKIHNFRLISVHYER